MVPVIQDEGCDTAGLPKLRTLYNPQDWSQLLATPNDHSCTSDPLITTPASKGSSSCWKSKLILEAFHAAQAVTGCPTSIHQAAPRTPGTGSREWGLPPYSLSGRRLGNAWAERLAKVRSFCPNQDASSPSTPNQGTDGFCSLLTHC